MSNPTDDQNKYCQQHANSSSYCQINDHGGQSYSTCHGYPNVPCAWSCSGDNCVPDANGTFTDPTCGNKAACEKHCSPTPPPPPPPTPNGSCNVKCSSKGRPTSTKNYADQAMAFIRDVNAATTTANKITCITVDGEQNGDYGNGICAIAAAAEAQNVKLTDIGLAHGSTINAQALSCDADGFGLQAAAYPEFYWVGELGEKSTVPSVEKCYNCPQACKFKFSPRYSCSSGTCKTSESGPFQKLSDCTKSCGKQCLPEEGGPFTDKYCNGGCSKKESISPLALYMQGSQPRAGASVIPHYACQYPPDECAADQIDRCATYCAETIYNTKDPVTVANKLVLDGVSGDGITCIQENNKGKTWPMFSIEMLNNPFNNGKPSASCIQTKYGGNSCGTFNGFGSWTWPQFQQFLDTFYAKTKAPQMAVYEWQFVPPTWMDDGIKVKRGSRPYKLALWHEGVVGTATNPTTFLQYAQDMANFVRDKAFDRVVLSVMDPSQFPYSSVSNVAKWVDMMPEGVEICAQLYIDTKDANWNYKPSLPSSDYKCKPNKEFDDNGQSGSSKPVNIWVPIGITIGVFVGIAIIVIAIYLIRFRPKSNNAVQGIGNNVGSESSSNGANSRGK